MSTTSTATPEQPVVRRGRPLRAIAAIALVCLTTSACSAGGLTAVSASVESPPRPAPELPADPELPPPDSSLPDLPLTGDPDALQQCIELTAAYTEIIALTFTGDDDGQLPGLFEQLEAAVPDDVRDDLATVRRIVNDAVDSGLLDTTGALLSTEYQQANEAVINWLTDLCGGVGS